MKRKTPAEVRKQASLIVAYWANERERDGDPEGADLFRQVSREILKLRLTVKS